MRVFQLARLARWVNRTLATTQPKAVTVAVVLVRAPNHRQLAEDLSRYVGGHSCNTWSTMSDCHSFSDFDALSNVMG